MRLLPGLLVVLIVSVVASGCSLASPSPQLSRPEAVEVALDQAGLGLYDMVISMCSAPQTTIACRPQFALLRQEACNFSGGAGLACPADALNVGDGGRVRDGSSDTRCYPCRAPRGWSELVSGPAASY